MTSAFFVTDTHPLVWYLAKQDKKLPKKVLALFKSAQNASGAHIFVPTAVVWEISQLMRKTSRLTAMGSFEELIRGNFFFRSLSVSEVHVEDLIIAHSLSFTRDPFDSLIVATAV